MGESGACGIDGEVARRLAFGGNAPLTNAGALDDPLIARIDDASEVGIAHDAGRQI